MELYNNILLHGQYIFFELIRGAFHCVKLYFETLQRLGVYIILFIKKTQLTLFKKHRKNSKKKRTVLKLCFQFIRQTWKLKNQLKNTYYFHKMKKAYCAIKNCVFRKVFLKFDQAFKDKIQCALRNHYCFCWIILLQLQLFVCSSPPPACASKRPL